MLKYRFNILGQEMKINFSESEYSTLLDMIFISDWIMTSFDKNAGENIPEKYKNLRDKILALSNNFNVENKVVYDEQCKKHFFTLDQTDEMHELFLNEYNENKLWQTLENDLSTRDMILEMKLNPELEHKLQNELIEMHNGLREYYENEFIENGIENLKIIKNNLKVIH